MRTTTYIFAIIFIALLALSFTGCGGHNSEAWKCMDIAESIIEERPDSSYQILQSIETSSLKGDEERARYALLMSMALDKNYIDTTDFNVLQPAIDYYLKKGNPDEKLRTYYYQGRIFQNRHEDDNAMGSYYNGTDIFQESCDTLTYIRLLTAQGTLLYKQYKFKEFIDNSLKCANLLRSMDSDNSALFDYAKALNGAVLLNDIKLADSILNVSSRYIDKDPTGYEYLKPQILLYTIQFGSDEDRKQILSQHKDNMNRNEDYLDLAYGFCLIKDKENSLICFQKVDSLDSSIRPTKYLSIKSDVLALNGHYKEAYETHQIYTDSLESLHHELFSKDLLFAKKKHALEAEKLAEARNKDRAIWIAIMVLVLSTIIIGWQKHRHQLLRVRQKLSEQEREKVNLENENLLLRISQLESEREELKALRNSNDLPQQVSDAVKERIEMLNALLAEKITDNDTYSKSYSKWIDTVTSDREKFMNSTRLAFKASHPKFIEYLESHDLTEAEINYLCLYAIGLRGKEVGEYIQLKRHYHISSEIRSKLGIDEHETNIGIYVRKLLKQL